MRSLVLILALSAHAEIIDRIAVTVERNVITASAIEEHVRVTAFLNQEPLDLSPASRRKAADRLIEQALLRREMDASRFIPPTAPEVEPLYQQYVGRPERARYGVDESSLRRSLTLQLATLRFIELRFRPGSAATDAEIDAYYRDVYRPAFAKANPGKPVPELDDVREEIEPVLIQQKVDQSLDQWLKESRTLTRIRVFDEAFQ